MAFTSPTANVPNSPSPDPVSTAFNIGKTALDFGASMSKMFGGGDSQKGGYTLPPEFEIQYIQQFEEDMARREQDYQMVTQAYNLYDQKISALNNIISKGYNEQDFYQLQDSNMRLAQTMGGSAEELAKNGFLTKEDQNDLQSMKNIAQGDFKGQTSGVLEGQLADQKRQLEQDLTRQRLSPTQRLIALNQFEQNATQQRFGFAQQQFGMQGQLINQRAGLRQQGYGQSMNTLQGNMGLASQYMGAYNQLGQNYGNQYSAFGQALAFQGGLRQEGQEAYKTMGQFKFSNNTKDALKSGLIGPGTYMQQTGIDRGNLKGYARGIAGQEYDFNNGIGAAPQYDLRTARAYNNQRLNWQTDDPQNQGPRREANQQALQQIQDYYAQKGSGTGGFGGAVMGYQNDSPYRRFTRV